MKTTFRFALTVCFVSLATTVLAIDHTEDSLATVRKNIEQRKAILVDVRELDEWKEGHLEDATHIALSELRKQAGSDEVPTTIGKKISKEKIVYCHCASGGRVIPAGKILKKWGFDVRPLATDYDELLEAGFRETK